MRGFWNLSNYGGIYISVGRGATIGPRANLAIHHSIEHGTDFVDRLPTLILGIFY